MPDLSCAPLAHAHRDDSSSPTRWHRLDEHLNGVAERAAQFATVFGGYEWAWLAGMWHDIGKYQVGFQRYLEGEGPQTWHAWVGAAQAMEASRERGHFLAFPILGHHAGLNDRTVLRERAKAWRSDLPNALAEVPESLLVSALPDLPSFIAPTSTMSRGEKDRICRRMELWIRFLFSALVDADFLDTEEFFDPSSALQRSKFASINDLRARLDCHIDELTSALPEKVRRTPVNEARTGVLAACREAAEHDSGLFSLTVPTGGGKTLSAMSFALRHAQRHGLDRVIVVIPYTSIIEQNAEVYRQAVGAENVIEHHSNLSPPDEGSEELTDRRRLAAENWDAPIVVTTTVQFFESLFANRPSRCRKLHNIAQSVVVLDEVQALPPRSLAAVVEVLNELAANYRCTLLLTTATPPALQARDGFKEGLRGVHEIIDDPNDLARRLQRVAYKWPSDGEQITWMELADELAADEQVLCVVHRRADARELTGALMDHVDPDTVLHLSALMCPAHRRRVLGKVKRRLSKGLMCRLVSTQIVEAGVDLDFPAVYRALAGLDSIVQAAGRCNREGREDIGRVVVFRAPTEPPPGVLRAAHSVTDGLIAEYGGAIDVTDPAIFEDYFRRLYYTQDLDANHVQTVRAQLSLKAVAERFHIIEDGFTTTVVVPYDEIAHQVIDAIRVAGPSRGRRRALQPYTVNIYPESFRRLHEVGAVQPVHEDQQDLFVLTEPYRHLYSELYGLEEGDQPVADPAALIA